MKALLFIITLFTSTFAIAHTDHALGEGAFHELYHAVFWALFALVVYKGIRWYMNRNNQTKKQ